MNKKLLITLTILLAFFLTSCKQSEMMKDYTMLNDKHSVYEIKDVNYIVKKLENKESFYLLMGFPTCPWCQAIVPVINDVAKDNNVKKVYYLDIKDIRDNVTSAGHSDYLLLQDNYLKEVLDQEKSRINAPTFVKIENGIVKSFHLDTVESHKMNDLGVLPMLTDEQLQELKQILNNMFLS